MPDPDISKSSVKNQGKYLFKTLGCKANLYDSQILEAELQRRGFQPASIEEERRGAVDLCFVNSCTVTDEADRQSRKWAARLSKKNPNAKIVVTGCSAEVNPALIQKSPGVHFVVGNQDKPKLVDLVLKELQNPSFSSDLEVASGKILGQVRNYGELLSRHPMDREWPESQHVFDREEVLSNGEHPRTRGFLKIQEGCNAFCTYCVIPYGRGPSRSLPIDTALNKVKELANQNIREVVFTGTNIGDYGVDLELGELEVKQGYKPGDPLFEVLIERTLQETSVQRLRLGSVDPVEITSKILDLMSRETRFCAHFHVSLQSPVSKILRLMKRKYRSENVEETLSKIYKIPAPVGGIYVGMDVIAGFPGETDDDFKLTVEMLEKLPWSRLHVFPYSEREGTPATRLPGTVTTAVRNERAGILNALSLKRLKWHYENALKEMCHRGQGLDRVLVENYSAKDQGWWGYSSNYLRVLLKDEFKNKYKHNSIISFVPETVQVDESGLDVYFST